MKVAYIHSATGALLAVASLTYSAQAEGVKVSGDFRVRYEDTRNQVPGSPVQSDRSREVVRFRAGISSQVNEYVEFGARVATGSLDDPNTTDVTLGNFVDDLEVNLDRAFAAVKYESLFLTGGKFANPFRVTDLVWDGDVNPQGAAASYAVTTNGASLKATGMYAIVDEQSDSTVPDSDMFGAQGEISFPSENWNATVAGGYVDYDISSLASADGGDWRSNTLTADQKAYVSDFNLLNFVGVLELNKTHARYPVRFVGDYVKNLGAEVDGDQGFAMDLFVGKASARGDLRARYGYSEAETDAVLAAFSHDNTTMATNYRQHTVTLDWVAFEKTTVNVAWYLSQFKDRAAGISDEFVSRLRLDAVVTF
jgi:hypothetical protein